MTDVDKKKQALAVTLSLSGQTRVKVIEIDFAKLSGKYGMQTLIGKLDKTFVRDSINVATNITEKKEKTCPAL